MKHLVQDITSTVLCLVQDFSQCYYVFRKENISVIKSCSICLAKFYSLLEFVGKVENITTTVY